MKKLLAIILFAVSLQANAKEIITIVYAFSPADTMANYTRTLIEEANKSQGKYIFVFDSKPGAGNTVAANYVKNTPNTILATSSALFIRPNFYPNDYSVSSFKELLPQCDAPMGVASQKYRSWKEVPTDHPVTIGVSGLGITTHLVALQLAARYPNLQIIPFKSTNDSIIATVSGQVDLTMGFINDELRWAGKEISPNKRLTILGVTGSRTIIGIEPLAKQGFPAIIEQLNAPHHLVVPITMPDTKFKEIRDILKRANQAKSVHESYAVDYSVPFNIDDNNIQPWFHKQNSIWKQLTAGIKLEK